MNNKPRKTDRWRKSLAIREQMALGKGIADRMPKFMEAKACAKALGISTTRLRELECLTLAKVAHRLQDAMLQAGVCIPLFDTPETGTHFEDFTFKPAQK